MHTNDELRCEREIRWQHRGRCGTVVVELWHIQPTHIQVFRLRGSRLPAVLLGPILDAALGPEWRSCAAGHPEINYLRSGRIRITMRGIEDALKLSRGLRIEDQFCLPVYAIAAIVGPDGLGKVLPEREERVWELE